MFCYVAQRMTAEGSEKTWDQCRIKLKNLKSQYRYVKDRIPNIDEVDLEDDEVLKQLITECQGRGISPSNIKHLRYLRRFLQKTTDFAANSHFKPTSSMDVSLSQMISESKVNMASVIQGVASTTGAPPMEHGTGTNSNYSSASPRTSMVRSPYYPRSTENEGWFNITFAT